jgi:hypothetical protein
MTYPPYCQRKNVPLRVVQVNVEKTVVLISVGSFWDSANTFFEMWPKHVLDIQSCKNAILVVEISPSVP